MLFIILSVPDKTVYEIDNGSYLVSYNSFKHTRRPVLLMYCKQKSKNNNLFEMGIFQRLQCILFNS